eukprot:CAMPEP_0172747816 /NCGR_PEP_ID=MMETSP1074-20121228/143691_1 /TAXON_ID=2916 /ORGANISM="Ceratium fusus, Strain PA161109" /LENGTH=55 /DNA_ID=CAMNT_0013579433 /DNA_START=61 /DNA_END=225 /DNA_ORIENTATION=+
MNLSSPERKNYAQQQLCMSLALQLAIEKFGQRAYGMLPTVPAHGATRRQRNSLCH